MRSLVGLDRAAATEALSGFIGGKTLTAAQHDFIALVVSDLTANGLMDAQLLYDQPFMTVAPGGPEEIFPVADVDDLVARITSINQNAKPTPPDFPGDSACPEPEIPSFSSLVWYPRVVPMSTTLVRIHTPENRKGPQMRTFSK